VSEITKQDLDGAIEELEAKFESEKLSAIKLIGTSIMDHPELRKFLGNEPFDKMLAKGIVALKVGYYKVIEQPYYKEYDNNIGTFAAKVLYFEDPHDICIEYPANIGPMVNAQGIYVKIGGSSERDQLFYDFQRNRASDSKENNFLHSKALFFNELYRKGKIFYIRSSEFSKLYPKSKEIKWSFIK